MNTTYTDYCKEAEYKVSKQISSKDIKFKTLF